MIHHAARRLVGWISPPDRLNGYAVLVGSRYAVTRAHMLSIGVPKPTDPVVLWFPNLGLNATARVTDWRP